MEKIVKLPASTHKHTHARWESVHVPLSTLFLPGLQTLTSVLCSLRRSAREVTVRTRCPVMSATAKRASTTTAICWSALVSSETSLPPKPPKKTQLKVCFQNVADIIARCFNPASFCSLRCERMPRWVSVHQRPLRQHWRILLLQL